MKKPNKLLLKSHLVLIIISILLILTGLSVGLFTYISNTSREEPAIENSDFYSEVSDVLGANSILPDTSTLVSSRGFTAQYDPTIITARAQTTDESSTSSYISGIEYTDEELKETRPYSIFKFELKDVEQELGSFSLLSKVQVSVITNIRADWLTTRKTNPQHANKSSIDILVDHTIESRLSGDPQRSASGVIDVTIGDTSYKKVTISTTYTSLGQKIAGPTQDIYMTIQNGRPYWIELGLITEQNINQLPALEPIIASVQYPKPEYPVPADGDSLSTDTYTQASSSSIKLPAGTSYVPKPIDNKTILKVVAKNQPAVVRIGASLCIDVDLLDRSGGVGLSLKSVCTAGIGSGSIVSTDGYIATNGHVTDLSDDNALSAWGEMAYQEGASNGSFSSIRNLLNYAVKINKISSSSAEEYINSLKKRDRGALAALSQLIDLVPKDMVKVKDRRTSYAVQTSNEPMRVKLTPGQDLKFVYSSSILSAGFIDSNFDPNIDLRLGFGSASDVAILKMQGSNFPITEIGSIALGFPAFVDGGLMTKKSTTVPAVTQGNVAPQGIGMSGSYKLISTTVPIAQGNSGGPAFNDSGQQIGLNTYSKLSCADMRCFGSGTARDVADFVELLKVNGITLKTEGSVARDWNEGIESLSSGNYKKATTKFNEVSKEYPANYLAASLATFAESRQGGADDTSGQSDGVVVVMIVASVLIVAGISTIIVVILKFRKDSLKPPSAPAYVPPLNPAQQPAVMPQQQPYYTQPTAPAAPTIATPTVIDSQQPPQTQQLDSTGQNQPPTSPYFSNTPTDTPEASTTENTPPS
jgi:hypothetical protein